ncbi:MAG: hypothetical protein NC401_11535 [Ruminococcus sp.]|nr:hypothetical protein [Ruminococcus sp.]
MEKYRAQSAARLVPINFYNDEKRQYILEKLRKQNVQFVEDNSVIYVPEHYAKPVEDIAATFKPSVNSQTMRERLKFTLDRLIYTAVSFENMLELLGQMGYGVKRGKYTAIKLPNAQRFMRLQSLGEGYSEFELKRRIKHRNEIPDDFKQSEEYYANALEKPFYGAMNSVITLVRTFASTPTKKDVSRVYSFKNDKKISELCNCLGTLSEFNIGSREELYKAAENLQTRIDNCNNDERDDLQIQYARISSVIRTYEEIIEGNYIDNLIRAEKEHKDARERAEQQKQEPTQTVNRKPKKFGRH